MTTTTERKQPRRRRPGLRLIMLLVALIILAMPISGVYLFRIYENELVRQTETELIAQGALFGSIFKERALDLGGAHYGRKLVGIPPQPVAGLIPITPRLDLIRDEILPRSLGFQASLFDPDAVAVEIGAGIESIIKESGRITLSSIYVLDYRGFVVAGSAGHGLSMDTPENVEISEALNGRYHSVMRERPTSRRAPLASASRSTGFRVFCAVPVMNGDRLVGVIHLSRTPRDIIQALYHEGPNVVRAGVLSIGLLIVVVGLISIMVIRPVKRLARDVNLVAEGVRKSLPPDAPINVVEEVAELRLMVADMADRLRHRSDYLKAFASGVSHEFKTPLTSIKGAMELLSEHGQSMDEATRARFENNILGDLDRLEGLVGRLLTLARAEAQAETFQPKDSKVEAAALIEKLAAHYQALGHEIELEDVAPVYLAVPGDVLETVLRNLFDNSRDVGATKSFVEMELNPIDQSLDIFVSDNGPGVPEEVQKTIFEPFFTTRKNKGGTGLGLSLARTLLSPHKGTLDLAECDDGAAFVLNLPLAKGKH